MAELAALIANMHFWTWSVDEVLDLVLWMRAYNAAHAGGAQLSFRGFDLQYSQQAIAAINAYLQRVDPANAGKVQQNLQCANMSYAAYQTLSAATRDKCRGTVNLAYQAIASARDHYVAASSAGEYEPILRYARVVVQFEDLAGHTPTARDGYIIPYNRRINARDGFGNKRVLVTGFDDNRLDNLYQLDLRLAKSLRLARGPAARD